MSPSREPAAHGEPGVPGRSAPGPYLGRPVTAIAAAAVALGLLYVLWRISHVLLIVFAGVLGAVFLDALARLAQSRLRLPRAAAVALAVALIVLVIAGFGFAVGPQLVDQSRQLADLLPESVERLSGWLESHPWGHLLVETRPRELIPAPADLLGQISGVFSSTFGGIASAVIIIVLAIYLVIAPRTYTTGLLLLLPPSRRARGHEVMAAIGRALRWWLVGRSVSMIAVGILTAVGLELIGLPAALALGVLAGGLSFVPYIGPIVAAVPALLIALPQWPWVPLWVLAIYVGVQFLEGNLITPFVQERAVALPPVVLLTSQLAIGLLFGLLGVLLATPLAVVGIVLVQMLYVQDLLGEPIRVLGEHSPAARRSGLAGHDQRGK